jgi:Cu-Zn family superoxide dismutase
VASPGTGATIDLRNAQGDVVGQATFMPDAANAVQLTVRITDLDPGEHGIHIHMVGRCDPPDFMSAGDHFNPTGAQHGLNNPQGPHAGDLPTLTVGPDRHAAYQASTGAVTLRPGPTSIYDADGSALVIHAQPDDQMTDPSGNSGARIACGVIPPAQ